ncbi:G-protein coupled receptor 143 [Papilio machaon]|uniref:G-protein coupled receptor 143 n=2 Tax=Papilio machaon TaxID=76193 RepID=A0A194QL75_PAPMA|nr:G-protein coupled receptor 143 isoform X1 [Papilio machaon]XP_045542904.1 G-protein coupled receptor 143 isoform X1 [Papilio machaon]KPJ06129.1 G-protein coupled receptor 143 [Papilio machaon]
MSDPTIQTFCCHHTGSKEDLAIRIMDEFNTESYNIVCLVSSTIGILGSIYQIFPCKLSSHSDGFGNMTTSRARNIIIWLAVADLMASLGVLVRSSLWLRYKSIMPLPDDEISVLFCSITSAWTQYFYTATWFWTLFYAIDTLRTIKGRDSHPTLYHSIAWGIPAATTGIGLSILYIPNATCHNLKTVTSAFLRILPNYFATYIPIAMVMIVNPVLYILAGKEVEMTVALPLAQFTSKERRVVDTLKLKFFLINAVFYVCWLPNLVNGVMIWTMWFNMPVKIIISIWYIMALMNPMQALLNALVYRRWNTNGKKYRPTFSSIHKELNLPDELSPLLGSEPPRMQLSPLPPGINNYATM